MIEFEAIEFEAVELEPAEFDAAIGVGDGPAAPAALEHRIAATHTSAHLSKAP